MPSSNSRFLCYKTCHFFVPQTFLRGIKKLFWSLVLYFTYHIQYLYFCKIFLYRSKNKYILYLLIHITTYCFLCKMREITRCLFEPIVNDVEVKKLSIETNKTFHTRDFRITSIFRWVRIYLCYLLLRCMGY